MCKAPFLDEVQRSTRVDPASQDFSIKRKRCVLTLVLRVEVRQTVLSIEHANHDPEECHNNRYVRSVSFFLCPPTHCVTRRRTGATRAKSSGVTGRPVALTRLFGGLLERTIPGMTRAARAVLADALRLGPDERAELAAEVLASLDGPADAGAEAAWEQEIRRRTEAIDAGTVESESWDDVKNRIERETLGR